MEKEEIAGANIVVIRDGQEMAFAADGYADIEAGKKYERDTIARLYSMTKPVTSAAAMLLMERGLLDPGAFVEEFLPGFHNAIVASGGKCTAGMSQVSAPWRRKSSLTGSKNIYIWRMR